MTGKRHFKKASSLQTVTSLWSAIRFSTSLYYFPRNKPRRGKSGPPVFLELVTTTMGGGRASCVIWAHHCGLSSACGFPNPSWPVFSPLKNEDPGSTYLMVVVKHRLGISPKAFRTSPCPSHSNTQNTVSYYYHSQNVLEFLPWSIRFLLTSFWPDIPISQKCCCEYTWVDINRKKNKNVQMGLTQGQFSFSNYKAIKRMRAASVLNTFPNNLAQGSITVQTSTKSPGRPLHSPVEVSRAGCIFFWPQETSSSKRVKIGIVKTATKSKHISPFWGSIKVELHSCCPGWKKTQAPG